jgi:demethylmenaquinone methyltransferase / 2-methoxy-6-polyprenyl-1,4-benzoquinol methylase
MTDEKTNFGYKTIDSKEKNSLVGKIFSSVASRYDLMNDVMSLGVHHYWKNNFVNQIPFSSGVLLDLAGGTADIGIRYYKKMQMQGNNNFTIIESDINHDMLKCGQDKVVDSGILTNFEFLITDAGQLALKDNSVDCVTIAFGIRNVTNINQVLAEIYRVLKPGGKFMCLEFSQVSLKPLAEIYDKYSFKLIPWLGEIIADDRDSYQYLVESIRVFPKQEQFLEMIKNTGFIEAKYVNLTGGIVAIHSGWKV